MMFDSKKFVSLDASKRVQAIASKAIIKERGFVYPMEVVQLMVQQRGWENLTKKIRECHCSYR